MEINYSCSLCPSSHLSLFFSFQSPYPQPLFLVASFLCFLTFWIFRKVSCGNQSIKFRTASSAEVKDWVSAINDAGLKPKEGWCNTHRFGSFAPQRGLTEDGSHVQWFIDGKAAYGAIASSIESAKSEVQLFNF